MSGIPKKVHQSVVDELNAESKAKVEAIRELNASDHVNRNLQGIIAKKEKELKTENTRWTNASNERDVLQETNKKYRNKIGRLEEKLKQNEEAYFSLQTKKYNKGYVDKREKEWQEKSAKLSKKIAQLEECNLGVVVPAGREVQLKDTVAELEQNLEEAKEVIETRTAREKELRISHKQAVTLKDLYESQLKDVRKQAGVEQSVYAERVKELTGELAGVKYCYLQLTNLTVNHDK
jgi:sulfite reductase beta subunit-like hemoprotein